MSGRLDGIWIVVLNWRGLSDTVECLRSLEPARQRGASVLVVDNGSDDGSEAAIREGFPAAVVLQTGRNLGFTGGNNIGLSHALAHGADHICVLNNDTTVEPDFLDALLHHSLAKSRCASSPRIERSNGGVWFGGGIVEPDGFARHLHSDELPALAEDRRPRASEVLTGCCLFASADIWRAVGLFDPRYFLMFEDTDWSLRAAEQGVTLEVVPASVVHHQVSASFTGATGVVGHYYYARNAMLLLHDRLGLGRRARLRFAFQHCVRPAARQLRVHRRTGAMVVTSSLTGVMAGMLGRGGEAPEWLRSSAGLIA